MLLIYVADAIWIIALSIMAGASRTAGRRMAPDTRVPMQLGGGGWRARRNLALAFTPVLATLVGLALLVAARRAESANAQLLLFGVRAFTASTIAAVHMLWLNAALTTLREEGALKP